MDGLTWMNATSYRTTGVILDELVTVDDAFIAAQVTVTDRFEGISTDGLAGFGPVPDSVTMDYFWTGSPVDHPTALTRTAVVQFSGLPARLEYRLTALCARSGDDSGHGYLTRFAAGDLTFDVDAGNNTSELVTFENLSASPEGTIDLKIAVSPDGNARFACLNGLILEVLDNNSAYWGPCRVIDRMYVNTSGWLGWLMSGAAPWVYCYNIEGWLCIDAATIGHAGSWVYIPR